MTDTIQYLIAAACLLGAGFITFWCSFARIPWPLTILSALLAVIALQLYLAFKGNGAIHDLSALRAMHLTVVPALIGGGVGLLTGSKFGLGLIWRNWQGAATGVLALAAAAAVVGAWLV